MGWFSNWVGRVAARALESDMLGGYDFQEYADASGGVQSVAASRHREVYYSNAFRACLLAKARPLSSLPVHVGAVYSKELSHGCTAGIPWEEVGSESSAVFETSGEILRCQFSVFEGLFKHPARQHQRQILVAAYSIYNKT